MILLLILLCLLMPFAHEKLTVYRHSIAFVAWAKQFQDSLPAGSSSVRNQLDRASISIPLNIAEGNAKRSLTDRARFLQISQGSAVECAACLDVAIAQGLVTEEAISDGKDALERIVKMLFRLIEHCRSESVDEEQAAYGSRYLIGETDQEKE